MDVNQYENLKKQLEIDFVVKHLYWASTWNENSSNYWWFL